jgi:hypothetical protein
MKSRFLADPLYYVIAKRDFGGFSLRKIRSFRSNFGGFSYPKNGGSLGTVEDALERAAQGIFRPFSLRCERVPAKTLARSAACTGARSMAGFRGLMCHICAATAYPALDYCPSNAL